MIRRHEQYGHIKVTYSALAPGERPGGIHVEYGTWVYVADKVTDHFDPVSGVAPAFAEAAAVAERFRIQHGNAIVRVTFPPRWALMTPAQREAITEALRRGAPGDG